MLDLPAKAQPCLLLTNGMLDGPFAKTAHGILRGSKRFQPIAVIDDKFVGRDAGEVMDGQKLGIPIFASIAAFYQQQELETPHFCVVGVALPGGKLPDAFRKELIAALKVGLSIANGLHTFLSDDPEMIALASEKNLQLIDVRKARPRSELQFWSGDIFSVQTPRIAILGIDCAVGKRTTCQWLLEACRDAGIKAEMIYTGQTGWMQGHPYGFILDSTVNDFVSGEIEKAIVNCDRALSPDVMLIEGQSALKNPTGPCGSEFLLSGQAKYVILQHTPGRPHYEDTHVPLGTVEDEAKLIECYGAKLIAVTINEEGLSKEEAIKEQNRLEQSLGIPVIRPLEEGLSRIIPRIQTIIAQ